MEWNDFLAKTGHMVAKRNRAWRRFMSRTTKLAAIADPRTSGNECLCRNWGNDESRRIWADAWNRWHAYANECDRRYRAWWDMACGRRAA